MWLSPLIAARAKSGRRHLEGEALADEAGEFRLVVERVDGRNHAAGAVAEQEDRQAGLARLGDLDHAGEVGDIVVDVLDVEPLAFRLAAAAEIEGVDGEAACDELLRRPEILAAMRIDAVADDDHRPGRRPPAATTRKKILRPPVPSNVSSVGGVCDDLFHRNPPCRCKIGLKSSSVAGRGERPGGRRRFSRI